MEYNSELKKLVQEIYKTYLLHISMDVVIFGFHEGQLKVLLLRWKGTDEWLLPGGRIRHDENLNDAAYRSLQGRTGLTTVFLEQFYTFGDVERYKFFDKRETLSRLNILLELDEQSFQRDVSVGYYALVDYAEVVPTPDVFTEECRWWDLSQVPILLFDHNDMIALALKTLRRQLSYQPVGINLLPEKFTMPDLQRLYETILGRPLDRRNFQKRILSYGILERLSETKKGVAHKAPYLYRFNPDRYKQALDEGMFFAS
ncbi:NUDIX domain-containing protein [Larkinella ripae]